MDGEGILVPCCYIIIVTITVLCLLYHSFDALLSVMHVVTEGDQLYFY